MNLDHHWVEVCHTFADKQIYSLFGLSLNEFLRFPSWKTKQIFDIADTINKKKSNAYSNISKELDQLGK